MIENREHSGNRKQVKILLNIGIISAFATLSFVGTTAIRIPIPATGGYFNIGDTFVFVSALLYGPIIGLFVGMIGPAFADAIGFPQFVFATAVVKGFEGLVIGIISKKNDNNMVVFLSLLVGIFILVAGYFIFEAYIYTELGKSIQFFAVTDYNAAIAEILPNTLQGVFSAVLAFAIWKLFQGKK